MSHRTPKNGLPVCVLALAGALAAAEATAQTPTPSPTPTPTVTPIAVTATVTTWTTENDHAVSGVNVQEQPDGTVWFLIPSNDRIVQLQTDGVTFKQWQIRDDKHLGANPVKFQLDGQYVWFLENGESQIDAGFSAIGRLDTVSGAIREWIIPGSRPAAFYRSPDGSRLWVPLTNGRLQLIDLNTLVATDFRSTATFAYSDMVVGPDGAFWLADFGNNRIVRWVPGAAQETSWTIADPNLGRLNSSQLMFDSSGALWISQLSGTRLDRFDPASNEISVYGGFLDPIHFDILGGHIYVSEAAGDNGRVVAFDPMFAGFSFGTLVPRTLDVSNIPDLRKATIRDSTAVVSTFTSTRTDAAASDVKITNDAPGLVRTQFPSTNAYGLTATGRGVWVGSQTRLVHIQEPTIGTPGDLSALAAAQFGISPGARIQSDVTLVNRGSGVVAGDAVFLYSPGAFLPSASFSVDPSHTAVFPDFFGRFSNLTALQLGPVRLRVAGGAGGDLAGSIRSMLVRSDGATYGFALPILQPGDYPAAGSELTLFLGHRDAETSVLNVYSPTGGEAVATLVAPDGTLRGTRLFQLGVNGAQTYNPAASAFGVDSEPGDVVHIEIHSGAFEAVALVLDLGNRDIAAGLPIGAATSGVFPNLSNFAGPSGRLSDIRISNPDASRTVDVSLTFRQDGGGTVKTATVTVPAGGSRTIENILTDFFGVLAGGSVTYVATGPVAVSARVASRRDEGDYGTFFPALDPSQAIAGGASGEAIGVPSSDTRQTDLLLFNSGAAGVVTVVGIDASGAETGRETLPIGSQATLRRPAIGSEIGGSSVARLRLEAGPGTTIYAAAEQIDLGTGDMEISRLR
jgi:streptogramin lyase